MPFQLQKSTYKIFYNKNNDCDERKKQWGNLISRYSAMRDTTICNDLAAIDRETKLELFDETSMLIWKGGNIGSVDRVWIEEEDPGSYRSI